MKWQFFVKNPMVSRIPHLEDTTWPGVLEKRHSRWQSPIWRNSRIYQPYWHLSRTTGMANEQWSRLLRFLFCKGDDLWPIPLLLADLQSVFQDSCAHIWAMQCAAIYFSIRPRTRPININLTHKPNKWRLSLRFFTMAVTVPHSSRNLYGLPGAEIYRVLELVKELHLRATAGSVGQ